MESNVHLKEIVKVFKRIDQDLSTGNKRVGCQRDNLGLISQNLDRLRNHIQTLEVHLRELISTGMTLEKHVEDLESNLVIERCCTNDLKYIVEKLTERID